MSSDISMTESDRPHALVVLNDLGCRLVWVRPSYGATLQTLRAWFAIQLVEYSQSNDIRGDFPNPAIMSYEQIGEWIGDEDLGWDILLLPVNAPVDPLQDFLENSLPYYPVARQEAIRRNVISAVESVSGQHSGAN